VLYTRDIPTAFKPAAQVTISKHMSRSFLNVAISYFLDVSVPTSHYSYLPAMLMEFSPSACIFSSINAVALANLARQRNDGQLMRYSRAFYVRAINEVNLALKSKEEVSSNGTLVATQILGLFEAIALNDIYSSDASAPNCLKSWIAHTNGTLSLIRFRGKELLDTDFGKRVYIQVANRFRANCVQMSIQLPPEFVELDRQIVPMLRHIDPTTQFFQIVDSVCDLVWRVRGKSSKKTSSPELNYSDRRRETLTKSHENYSDSC
jgi:Fungal specific transcription factor domain